MIDSYFYTQIRINQKPQYNNYLQVMQSIPIRKNPERDLLSCLYLSYADEKQGKMNKVFEKFKNTNFPKKGKVYVFSHEEKWYQLKIGRTTRQINIRLKQWKRQDGKTPILRIVVQSHNPAELQKLVHKYFEIYHFPRQIWSPVQKKKVNRKEWYNFESIKLSDDYIRQVIQELEKCLNQRYPTPIQKVYKMMKSRYPEFKVQMKPENYFQNNQLYQNNNTHKKDEFLSVFCKSSQSVKESMFSKILNQYQKIYYQHQLSPKKPQHTLSSILLEHKKKYEGSNNQLFSTKNCQSFSKPEEKSIVNYFANHTITKNTFSDQQKQFNLLSYGQPPQRKISSANFWAQSRQRQVRFY